MRSPSSSECWPATLARVLVATTLVGCVSPNNEGKIVDGSVPLDAAVVSTVDATIVAADGPVTIVDAPPVVTDGPVRVPDAACSNGACPPATCPATAVSCQLQEGVTLECGARSWDFEDGARGAWEVWDQNKASDSAVTGALVVSNARAHSGSSALRVPVSVTRGLSRMVFQTSRCPTSMGWTPMTGRTASFQIFVEGAPNGSMTSCGASGSGLNAAGVLTYLGPFDRVTPVPNGQWTRVSYPYSGEAAARAFTVTLDCILGELDWSGAVYLDDISVN